MELLNIKFEDSEFDRVIHNALPDGGDLAFYIKDKAMVSGNPAVAISFSVKVTDIPKNAFISKPDVCRVQSVTSVRLLLMAARILCAKYPHLATEQGLSTIGVG